jgi:DNA polymerase-3 subunit gamma/tau
MENRVLALKYRPRRFEDLIGQGTVSQTLSLALDTRRLSHAYLFSGLRGSGKTSTARIMAKSLLCDTGPTSKSCEVCSNCVAANKNSHIDIIEMDAASNRGIDDIKELIEHTKYKPSVGRYKVFVIDEVHMLTTQAFNALLKTLEEPPEFVKFILATTDPLKLPATILSRTQHFRFKKIAHKDVLNHLEFILNEERIEFEVEALDILSRSGAGSLRDTLTLLDQSIIYSKGKITATVVTDMLGLLDPKFMDKLFGVILESQDIGTIVDELNSYDSELVLDEMSIYLKNAMVSKSPKFDIVLYDRFFKIIADSKSLLHYGSDGEFVTILTLMKLQEATKLKSIDELIDEASTKVAITPPQQNRSVSTEQASDNGTIDNSFSVEQSKQEQRTTNTQVSSVPTPKEIDPKEKFGEVIKSIYDKNYELGSCFEKNFEFLGKEGSIIKLKSYASGECKTLLWQNFAHIRSEIENIFGIDTHIDFIKANP